MIISIRFKSQEYVGGVVRCDFSLRLPQIECEDTHICQTVGMVCVLISLFLVALLQEL